MKKDEDDFDGVCQVEQTLAEHFQDFQKLSTETGTIHEIVKDIHGDTKYLTNLPIIVTELQTLNEKLVGAATNRNFMPLTAGIAMIGALGFICVILAGTIVVQKFDGKTISLAPSKIEVTR